MREERVGPLGGGREEFFFFRPGSRTFLPSEQVAGCVLPTPHPPSNRLNVEHHFPVDSDSLNSCPGLAFFGGSALPFLSVPKSLPFADLGFLLRKYPAAIFFFCSYRFVDGSPFLLLEAVS